MPFKLNIEFEAHIERIKGSQKIDLIESIRESAQVFKARAPCAFDESLVTIKKFTTTSYDGTLIDLYYYTCVNKQSAGPAVLHFPGSAFVAWNTLCFESMLKFYVYNSGVSILSVDYRRAPEFKYPCMQEDGYAGLLYLHQNANELKIDRERIAVMGDSSGGAIAASVAIMARDRKLLPALKLQILIYPLLNDQTIDKLTCDPDGHFESLLKWSYESNRTAWKAMLDESISGEVPYTAAPSRLRDYSDLPPAHITCGSLDIVRDENVDFASKLWSAGINCDLNIIDGAPHGFEYFGKFEKTKPTFDERIRILKSI